MSHIIPPLLSSSPPPIVCPLDDEDDEFGDFRTADSDQWDEPPESPVKRSDLDVNRNAAIVDFVASVPEKEEIASIDNPGELKNEEKQSDIQDFIEDDSFHSNPECHEENHTSLDKNESQFPSDTIIEENSIKSNEENRTDVNNEEKSDDLDELTEETSPNSNSELNDSNSTEESTKVTPQTCDNEEFQKAANSVEFVDTIPEDDTKFNGSTNEVTLEISKEEKRSGESEDFGDFSFATSANENTSENEEFVVFETHFPVLPTSQNHQTKEFGDFGSDSVDKFGSKNENHAFGDKNENDEFGDFSGEVGTKETFGDESEISTNEKFGDFKCEFGDKSENGHSAKFGDDDEFGDFTCEVVKKTAFGENSEISTGHSVEEFGDFKSESDFDEFGDFEGANSDFGNFESPQLAALDPKNAEEESRQILQQIFPPNTETIEDYTAGDLMTSNPLFNQLKDVTETNALVYQWSKSNSQKKFLTSLNVDTRNILYGSNWSKFNSSLSPTPLEPIKPEILTPTPAVLPTKVEELPQVQFDWTSAGLENPLDHNQQTVLFDLEQLVASLDISDSFRLEDNDEFRCREDDWELWLLPSTEMPKNLIDELKSVLNADRSATDVAKQETVIMSKPASPKLFPLRETHITEDPTDFMWSTTILTPELPRKQPEIADDFDDFQMVLPPNRDANQSDQNAEMNDFSAFQTSLPKQDTKPVLKPPIDGNKTILDTNLFGFQSSRDSNRPVDIFNLSSLESNVPATISTDATQLPSNFEEFSEFASKKTEVITNSQETTQDDEFTDFVSAAPPRPLEPLKPVLEPLKPVFEPLKPVIQYSIKQSTEIQWPDPGLTADDLRHIELSYVRKEETKKPVETKEEDEWTDFVSVKTSPVKSRTSTPDLPLSVFNLDRVQHPKQPIPVITASGVVQTRITPKMSVKQSPVKKSAQTNNDEDEEWSDFVCSPSMNGLTSKMTSQPNIITNPTAFDYIHKRHQPISTISSMPELDFIGGGTRSNRSKK